MLNAFTTNIKRRETPLYNRLYKLAKGILTFSVPSIKIIHLPLYHVHVFIREMKGKLYQGTWVVPLFKAKCIKCGSGLRLPNGMPLIVGQPRLYIGDNVSILDSTIASGHVFEEPQIVIGDRVTIGYHSDISASRMVKIGNDTIIAKDCFIADNDGHPVDPSRRRRHESVDENEITPVYIGENVWVGTGCYILKGSRIGDNSVVAANSVVVGDIPANVIAAGNPAKVVKQI